MLREILARFGIQVNTGAIAAANTAITGMVRNLSIFGALIAGGFLVRGLKNFVGEMVDLGDETAKTARQLGISADELSAWRFAAERSGVPAEQLTNGLRRLQRNIVDAGEGMETARRAFSDLGVGFRDANGQAREIEDILPEIADGFAALETDTQRSARAQQLFGRAGAQLLPFFENGSEGLEELRARFDELTGGGFGDFFENAEAAQDAMTDFDLAIGAVKASIATEILPALTDFVTNVSNIVASIREATEGTELWQAALTILGVIAGAVAVAMLLAFIKPIALFLLIAGIIALVVLLVQDFITFLEGGESAFGAFLEALGLDQEEVRQNFLRFFEDQKQFWTEDFPNYISRLATDLSNFGADFVQFWGTDVPKAFTDALQAVLDFNESIVTSIGEVILGVEVAINGFLNRVRAAIDAVRSGIQSVAGFLGVEVAGAPGGGAGGALGARPPGVTVPGSTRGGDRAVTNRVTQEIRVETTGDPLDITRRVREAVEQANDLLVRNTQRALTSVVGD